MAKSLKVAREWLSKIENERVPVSADLYLRFNRLKQQFEAQEEKPKNYPGKVIAPRYDDDNDPQKKPTATRHDVENYIERYMDLAEKFNPNRIPWAYEEIKENLPLSNFDQYQTNEER